MPCRECPHLFPLSVSLWKVFAVTVDKRIHHTEVDTHVPQAFAACRTGVVVARILCKAMGMHEMPARQLLDHTLQA